MLVRRPPDVEEVPSMESGHGSDVVLAREEEANGLVMVDGLVCGLEVQVKRCLPSGFEDLAKQSVGCVFDVDAPQSL